jgi:Swt1-like HEPN
VATNRKLKDDLLKKLGITEQALNLRAQRRKNELPMSTEQAYYTIAHDEGFDLSKYLSSDIVAEIRALVRDLKAGQAGASTNGGTSRKTKATPSKKTTVVKIAGMTEAELPGMTTKHANEARQMSDSVYPMLYLFENSLRDLIERVLKSVHGGDWWTKAVPLGPQKKFTQRKADERTDPWHGRRGNREIDYVDLTDLWLIIKDNWASFKAFFPSGQAWVESIITNDMNVSRRPLAHMNPLATEDVENVKNAFRKWTKLLNAIEDTLP